MLFYSINFYNLIYVENILETNLNQNTLCTQACIADQIIF